jgi:hypothetical protein
VVEPLVATSKISQLPYLIVLPREVTSMAAVETNALRVEFHPPGPWGELPDEFWVDRQIFSPSPDDRHLVWFLRELAAERDEARKRGRLPTSLLGHRVGFRWIRGCKPYAGLMWCFLHPQRPEEQRLAAWLLGCCGGPTHGKCLYLQAGWCSLVVRREIAKALRRIGLWRELRNLASSESDKRIRRLAQLEARNFKKILRKWQVPPSEAVSPPDRAFELFVELGPNPYRPKTAHFIRRLLEHIRALLAGARMS